MVSGLLVVFLFVEGGMDEAQDLLGAEETGFLEGRGLGGSIAGLLPLLEGDLEEEFC